jgi:hypothetical protein
MRRPSNSLPSVSDPAGDASMISLLTQSVSLQHRIIQ